VELREELDRLTDPDGNLLRVERLAHLVDGTLAVVLSGIGEVGTRLYRIARGTADLLPVPGITEIDALWPAGDRMLIERSGCLCLVDLAGKQSEVTRLPEGASSVSACWLEDGLHAGALVTMADDHDESQITVYPKVPSAVTLMSYAPDEGWVERAQVAAGSSGLSMSGNGLRLAWHEPVNVVPEEAMRGEFRGYDVAREELVRFTEGAGKARQILVHPGGDGVAYIANFSQSRPITIHTDLWWQTWDGSARVNLTRGGRSIDDVGWCPDGESLWVSTLDGVYRSTEIIGLDGQPRQGIWPEALGASSSQVAWFDGLPSFERESITDYPRIQVGPDRIAIPQPDAFDDVRCSVHRWTASDGLAMQGVLWDLDGMAHDAPLLVRAHGGPAGTVEAVRSEGVRFRHLLRAGYRLFIPAFRGSLGFGDDFLGANIGCQGVLDLDDIVTGIDHLAAQGLADPTRVGIFGGSYGGYMTLRALAVSDRFAAGVALYGFLDNRWMTLQTGDFTYETEYLAPVTWPRNKASLVSDVFSHLGDINQPLLLLHGDSDPICPWNQSLVAFHALQARDVPTGLVVYPGEGHGFRQKQHQHDAARRTLEWFLQHLAP
jgi:dienelactone hydrolase